MSVQVSTDQDTRQLILGGPAYTRDDAVIKQDAGRTADLEIGTILGKVAATGKFVPLTDADATDGSSIPCAILLELVQDSCIASGDVEDVSILVGQALVDEAKLIVESSGGLGDGVDSVLSLSTVDVLSVKDALTRVGIFMQSTVAVGAAENA